MQWIKSKGVISVSSDRRIVVELGGDIMNYYLSFIRREFWIDPQPPAYGPHITINLKGKGNFSYNLAKSFDKKQIEFKFCPDVQIGGRRKGFLNFWFRVKSSEIERIKEVLRIDDGKNFLGLHWTCGTSGKGNSAHRSWWPKTIKIKKNIYLNSLDGPG